MMRALVAAAALLVLGACTERQVHDAGEAVASAAPAHANDGIIYAQIESRFVQIDADSALHVQVASHGGAVRLSGRTKNAQIAANYLAAAKSVPGVRAVTTTIVADSRLPSATKAASEFALVAAVRAALIAQAGVNGVGVGIHSDGRGTIALRGRVASAAIATTLLDAAAKTPGVARVVDELHRDS